MLEKPWNKDYKSDLDPSALVLALEKLANHAVAGEKTG
jgi:hypothetical protein